MNELIKFHFKSIVEIDNQEEVIEFIANGYRKNEADNIVLYFKYEEVKYKFFVNKDELKVMVNDSVYNFCLDKKTKGIIRQESFLFNTVIETRKLVIEDNYIEIEYVMNFDSFVGDYKIILKLM